MLSVEREPYSSEKFVKRPEVTKVLKDLEKNLASSTYKGAQVHTFKGMKGTGKSWLALSLLETWKPAPETLSFLISFDPKCKAEDGANYFFLYSKRITTEVERRQAVSDLILWLLERLGTKREAHQPTDHELKKWLTRDIARSRALLLFIVDGLFEADSDLLQLIEADILKPILDASLGLTDSIIIMMAQGRDVLWQDPRLRVDGDTSHLVSLQEDGVRQQIESQVPEARDYSDAISAFGGGFPLNTLLLARSVRDMLSTGTSMSREAWVNALEGLTEGILEDHGAIEHKKTLQVLSVLDGFREHIAKPAWRWYQEISHAASPLPNERILVNTGLVSWRPDPTGKNSRYVIDDSIYIPMEWLLLLSDSYLWAALHCRAKAEYHRWAAEAETEDLREFFQGLASHHDLALSTAFDCGFLQGSQEFDHHEISEQIIQLAAKGKMLLEICQEP